MADKTINDLTATTTLNSGDLFELENTGNNSRKITAANLAAQMNLLGFSGARVYKTTSMTGLNFTTSAAITFDAEDYDTHSYHDTGSNTDRLTVPAAGYYNVQGHLQINSITSADFVKLRLIRFNSSAVFQEDIGFTFEISTVATGPYGSIVALGVPCSAGDFFRFHLQVESDTSINFDVVKFAIQRVY